MNGAELIVSALENEGVRQIFGIPGEEIAQGATIGAGAG
jgi:thiamine pyrophosphate-dependent acetolactate synthase large subunit-like protein